MTLTAITVFDGNGIAVQDHGDSMKGVAMPGHCLAGRKAQATNERRPAMEEDFVGHC